MACCTQSDVGHDQVAAMFEGAIDPNVACIALQDAEIFVREIYQIDYTQDNETVLVRYYACHLLYLWGHYHRVEAKSVDDVSETRKQLDLGDKEGDSPYLIEFRKLLGESDSDFLVCP